MSADSEVAAACARALDRLAPQSARSGDVAVAVSGGSDSISLLHASVRWARERGARICAVTVDHGLRPEAADEARFVASACDRLGVAHHTLVWSPDRHHISQARARQARYRLLATFAAAHGADRILLGHTEDDRFETFLMRARSGSRWYGLAAPLPSAACPVYPFQDGVRLLRPLLGLRRRLVRKALADNGHSWIEDPSNRAIRHERVRMRGVLLALEPETDRLRRIIGRLSALRVRVMELAENSLRGAAPDGSRLMIETKAFAGLPDEARVRLLEATIMARGARFTPPRRDALERLDADLLARRPMRSLGGLLFSQARGIIRIEVEPGRSGDAHSCATGLRRRATALLSPPDLGAIERHPGGIAGEPAGN
jgi:tRNA(Ile)-lysidine synthase